MSFLDDDTNEAHERRIVRCKACRARIVFLQSPSSAKQVPVDADTVEADDEVYEHGRHVSHFSTCSNPERFRKRS
jgi:DNA-directed RNA polymerase subunit RPC12/RpoP